MPARRSPRRLIANIQGMPKVGKTSLALTAPKPVGYIALEVGGEEGVIDKYIPDGKDSSDDLMIAPIRMDSPQVYGREQFADTKDGEKDYQESVSAAVQAVAIPALEKFYDAYYYSLENMATTVVDTGSDLWEIVRLANFGRLEKIPQLAYTQLNKIMDKLLDDAYGSAGSVLWLHHMKERWETYEDERGKKQARASGTFDLAGYGGIKKKVQATIELWREDLEAADDETGLFSRFHAQIIESRHKVTVMGRKYTTLDISFPSIAKDILGGTEKDYR